MKEPRAIRAYCQLRALDYVQTDLHKLFGPSTLQPHRPQAPHIAQHCPVIWLFAEGP